MKEWSDLFVATAGAASALAGLIFVGISISLKTVLEFPALVNRALISLTLLLCILTASILLLMPQKSFAWYGFELLCLGILVWLYVTATDFINYKKTEKQYKPHYSRVILLDQLALLPYLAGGIVLLHNDETGLYWIVPAMLLSFIKSIFDAWVLLIEVNR